MKISVCLIYNKLVSINVYLIFIHFYKNSTKYVSKSIVLSKLLIFYILIKLQRYLIDHLDVYFSGMIGSGLCVFSKIPIEETLFHKFDLNGYAHKVQHGDWFGGKGVGLVKLAVERFHINLYISHVRQF